MKDTLRYLHAARSAAEQKTDWASRAFRNIIGERREGRRVGRRERREERGEGEGGEEGRNGS